MRRNHILSLFSALGTLFVLSACNQGTGYNRPNWELNQPAQQAPNDISQQTQAADQVSITKQDLQNMPPVKVGILLPLSGQHAGLGNAMLNAAQMALFDIGHSSFELLPQDTKGTGTGAQMAAQAAIAGGAELIIGPVFADAVRGAKTVAANANINVIGFSTDWTLAGNNTFVMGFLPFDQVDRVMRYAALQNVQTIGAIIPNDNYGRVVSTAYKKAAQSYGINTTVEERFQPNTKNLSPSVERLATLGRQSSNAQKPFDAVFMPTGGQTALSVANLLSYHDMPPRSVRRIGTGLLDDQRLAREASLQGTWFAGPSPNARKNFESKYVGLYGSNAPRLTTLAYDATALAAILAQRGLKQNGRPAFDRTSITNPNGFAGIDGIFRFRRDGTAERGLAVLEFRSGRILVIDEAPKTFEKAQF